MIYIILSLAIVFIAYYVLFWPSSTSKGSFGSQTEFYEALERIKSYCQNKTRNRRCLVIINPISGGKKALKMFNYVKPLFESSDIEFVDVISSSKQNECINILKKYDLSNIDMIVGFGGDGTAYEIFNGLALNENQNARSIPVGLIPSGSGNGLAASFGGGGITLVSSVETIVKGNISSLDTNKITYKGSNQPLYATMLVGWGAVTEYERIADKIRFLGPYRLEIAAIFTIFFKSLIYKSKIEYLPMRGWDQNLKKYEDNYNENNLEIGEWKTLEGDHVSIFGFNVPYSGQNQHIAPFSSLSNGTIDLIAVELTNRFKIFSSFASLGNGSHMFDKHIKYIKIKKWKIKSNEDLVLNLDGEVVEIPSNEVEISSERDFFRVFTCV